MRTGKWFYDKSPLFPEGGNEDIGPKFSIFVLMFNSFLNEDNSPQRRRFYNR